MRMGPPERTESIQTFLPLPDFAESARVLDNKRLGDQRVHVLQIAQALWCRKLIATTQGVGPRGGKIKIELPREEWIIRNAAVGWAGQPGTRMWNHEGFALLEYGTAVCNEWTSRGFQDTCLAKIEFLYLDALDYTYMGGGWPKWMGREDFHASHRAALLFKDPVFYGQYGWTEEPQKDYIWPI